MVTADADTGMPARRLAMRATLSPCSASGMAQPRITSSTSFGAMPGARRSASAITVAASSSGRAPWSVPFGALPTGVRTAETITASFIVPQQILDGVGDLTDLAVEQVIGGVDHYQIFRLPGPVVELADVFERAGLVWIAVIE